MELTIPTISTARSSATPNMTARWPPLMRSMNGPMKRATTVNGAKLSNRNRMTFGRASFGLIERNIESASATAMMASPATMHACVRSRYVSGLSGGSPGPSTSSTSLSSSMRRC
ncbi:MAG: hypothetical protein EBS32_10795 [Actinobacteria bacterium]|nr:hypothetical protein [Actinomycetota bacterium]